MSISARILPVHTTGLLVVVCLVACPPPAEDPEATAGSTTGAVATTEATSSGGADGTTGQPTTSTTSTTTTGTTGVDPDTDTATTTTTRPTVCDSCTADQICVEILDEHTCWIDEPTPSCRPNPHGCVLSDPCSIACQDLCGPRFCEGHPRCATNPDALTCWSNMGQAAWQCDAFAQDDCIEGKKCVPYDGVDGLGQTKCVPVQDPADAVGEACTGPDADAEDSCEKGAFCFVGTCVALCIGSPAAPDCADPASTCWIVDDAYTLCMPRCDPLAPDCAADEVCISVPEGEHEFGCVLDASGDGGQASTGCEYLNVCEPGLVCRPGDDVSVACKDAKCCTPICDLMGAAVCPEPDQACVPFYGPGEAPAGYEAVGVCEIPG